MAQFVEEDESGSSVNGAVYFYCGPPVIEKSVEMIYQLVAHFHRLVVRIVKSVRLAAIRQSKCYIFGDGYLLIEPKRDCFEYPHFLRLIARLRILLVRHRSIEIFKAPLPDAGRIRRRVPLLRRRVRVRLLITVAPAAADD